MKSRDFCYWLQGYFELAEPKELTEAQIAEIRKHLSMVFVYDIDPSAGGQKIQDKLNDIHNEGVNNSDVLMRC